MFGVIVGTGTGGGIVVDGRVLTGRQRHRRRVGAQPDAVAPFDGDEWPGPDCYCGRTGCIETFLSGPGSRARLRATTESQIDATEIVARAAAGDAAAERWVRRYEERMARALASVINVLDPDVIVLGGGMSNVDRLYANVPRVLGAVCVLRHGDDAAREGRARRFERRPRRGVAVGRDGGA